MRGSRPAHRADPGDARWIERDDFGWHQFARDQDRARGQSTGLGHPCCAGQLFQELRLEVAQVGGPRREVRVFDRLEGSQRVVHGLPPRELGAAARRDMPAGGRQEPRVVEEHQMRAQDLRGRGAAGRRVAAKAGGEPRARLVETLRFERDAGAALGYLGRAARDAHDRADCDPGRGDHDPG